MQMSGFFMLHLYVDPEGESYEKLYGITPHAGRSRPEAYLKPAAPGPREQPGAAQEQPRSSQEQPRRSQEQPKSSPGEAQRQPSTYFWPEGGGPKVKKLRLGSIFTKSLGQQYTEIC